MPSTVLLPPVFDLVALDSVDDVMLEARRLANAGADEGTVIWSRAQTDARTRSGARWEAPAGNLHCAVIIRPDYDNAAAAELGYVATLAAGSALAGLLSPMTGFRYRWPNRLLLNELTAGRTALAYPADAPDPLPWLALGLSMNIACHPENPEPERYNSVHASGSPEVTVEAMLEDFTRWLLSHINRWADEGFAPLRRAFVQRADDVGVVVPLRIGGERTDRLLVEITDDGSATIETSDGDAGPTCRRIGWMDYFDQDVQLADEHRLSAGRGET